MTNRQIEIGDNILIVINQNQGRHNEGFITRELWLSFNYNYNEIVTVINILIEDYGLLRCQTDQLDIKIITAEGINAINIGLKKYIKKFNKNKIRPIKHTKWALAISIVLPIVLFVGGKIFDYKNSTPQKIRKATKAR